MYCGPADDEREGDEIKIEKPLGKAVSTSGQMRIVNMRYVCLVDVDVLRYDSVVTRCGLAWTGLALREIYV